MIICTKCKCSAPQVFSSGTDLYKKKWNKCIRRIDKKKQEHNAAAYKRIKHKRVWRLYIVVWESCFEKIIRAGSRRGPGRSGLENVHYVNEYDWEYRVLSEWSRSLGSSMLPLWSPSQQRIAVCEESDFCQQTDFRDILPLQQPPKNPQQPMQPINPERSQK